MHTYSRLEDSFTVDIVDFPLQPSHVQDYIKMKWKVVMRLNWYLFTYSRFAYFRPKSGVYKESLHTLMSVMLYCILKVAGNPVFSRSTNLESKLIEFFVFVNF